MLLFLFDIPFRATSVSFVRLHTLYLVQAVKSGSNNECSSADGNPLGFDKKDNDSTVYCQSHSVATLHLSEQGCGIRRARS